MPSLKEEKVIKFFYPKNPEKCGLKKFDIKTYEKDPDGSWLEIKYVNEGNKEVLDERINPTSIVYDEGKVTRELTIHKALTRELYAVAYIHNWHGFIGKDKKPLECNEKNKKSFSYEDGFFGALSVFIREVNRIVLEERETELKNFETSQAGKES